MAMNDWLVVLQVVEKKEREMQRHRWQGKDYHCDGDVTWRVIFEEMLDGPPISVI